MNQNTSSAVMQQRTEAHEIIHRSEAKAMGQGWYFTGRPCPKGHVAKRSVSNCECRKCVDDRDARRRAKDPETARAKDRAYHSNAVEARKSSAAKSRRKHVERRRQDDRERYARAPEKWKANAVAWGRKNKGKRVAMVAARRSWIKQATPKTLSAERRAEIKQFYVEAAGREGEWHVDHIVPLRGKGVCGLHVPWNLQIITGDENSKKGNRYEA